jgi:hypothetical protein
MKEREVAAHVVGSKLASRVHLRAHFCAVRGAALILRRPKT